MSKLHASELYVVVGPGQAVGDTGKQALARMLRWKVTQALATALECDASIDELESVYTFIEENWYLIEDSGLSAFPAVGQISSTEGHSEVALGTALLLVALGAEGRFVISGLPLHTVYLDICPILVEGTVEVESSCGQCTVSAHKHGQLTLVSRYVRNGAHLVKCDGTALLLKNESVAVQVIHAGSPHVCPGFLVGLELAAGVETIITDTVIAALELIRISYPEGLQWIAPVLRGLVLIHSPLGSSSGSSSSHPGLVYVSYPISADHLAVQIVHECAHQYLGAHHAWRPFTDGNPKELYYSPFKQTTRPLYNVLLALHAAVNIRSFTTRLLSGQMDTPYVVSEHAQLHLQIAQMLGEIRDAPGLTVAGRALVSELDKVASNHG